MKVKEVLLVLMLLIIATPLFASPVKDFLFTDINGNTRNWEDIKGTPVVINIGSHW